MAQHKYDDAESNHSLAKVSQDLAAMRAVLEGLTEDTGGRAHIVGISEVEARIAELDTSVSTIQHRVKWGFVICGLLLLSQLITWTFRLTHIIDM